MKIKCIAFLFILQFSILSSFWSRCQNDRIFLSPSNAQFDTKLNGWHSLLYSLNKEQCIPNWNVECWKWMNFHYSAFLRYNLKPGAFAIVIRLVESWKTCNSIWEKNLELWKQRSASYYNKAFIFHNSNSKDCIAEAKLHFNMHQFSDLDFILCGANLCIGTEITTKEPRRKFKRNSIVISVKGLFC